eukprot:1143611-Pelagomonas_calceolata.AAC.2
MLGSIQSFTGFGLQALLGAYLAAMPPDTLQWLSQRHAKQGEISIAWALERSEQFTTDPVGIVPANNLNQAFGLQERKKESRMPCAGA